MANEVLQKGNNPSRAQSIKDTMDFYMNRQTNTGAGGIAKVEDALNRSDPKPTGKEDGQYGSSVRPGEWSQSDFFKK